MSAASAAVLITMPRPVVSPQREERKGAGRLAGQLAELPADCRITSTQTAAVVAVAVVTAPHTRAHRRGECAGGAGPLGQAVRADLCWHIACDDVVCELHVGPRLVRLLAPLLVSKRLLVLNNAPGGANSSRRSSCSGETTGGCVPYQWQA